MACSNDPLGSGVGHRVKWNSGNPICLECGVPAISVRLDTPQPL